MLRLFSRTSRSSAFRSALAADFGKIKEFRLPDLGEKIKEATVQKWLVKEGEEVEQFQNLADVATDKLFTQIPAVENGKIHKLHVKEGQACQVGSILLELEVEEESAADQPAATKTKPAPSSGAAPVQKAQSNTSTPARSTSEGDKVLSTPAVREYAKLKGVEISAIQGTGEDGRVTRQDVDSFLAGGSAGTSEGGHSVRIGLGDNYYADMLASPAVRSFAKEHGVDISAVKGSGQHGRIVREDILAYKAYSSTSSAKTQPAKSAPSQPQAVTPSGGSQTVKMNPIMQGMVKSMNYAATVPHFYLKDEFDITKLVEFREKINQGKLPKDKIAIFSFIVKAFSKALEEFPHLNSSYNPDKPYEYEVRADHNVSVAIDTPNGLIAPNIKSVQLKSIKQIQQDILHLRTIAEAGRVGQNELFGGTIALSNIGSIGGTYAGPLNLPNQVCIVALGRTREVPGFVKSVVHEGKTLYDVQMRKVINVSFGCDHRVLDGATVTRFCNRWKDILENPEKLLVELK